ncbi:MAG TPA: hypothetical protein VGO93_30465 [Candidatus Xenobia bacterium]|jgi:hypothetical protein
MHRKLACLLVLLLTATALSAPRPLKMTLLVPANRSHLREYLGPDTAVIFVQLASLTDEETADLLEWVQKGGSLWFSDCRLAPRFGMEPAPLDVRVLSATTLERQPYGGQRHVALLTAVVYAATQHPLVDGLQFERGFLLGADESHVSTVKAGGDVVGLMRLTSDPHDPHADQMAAALRMVGHGSIVFRPVVTDGTFEYNLKQWVARQYADPSPTPDH